MDRCPRYYAVRLSITAAAFLAAWATFFWLGDSWWQLVVAVVMAVLFGQVALVSHDLAHRQIFRSRRPSASVGRIAGNLGIGMSYGWWMDKHTRHHANPNHEEKDPDVSPGALVWSENQAGKAKGVARFLGRCQAYLFFPLLLLEGLNLRVGSVRGLARPRLKRRWLEATLLFGHFIGYLAALFLVLSPGKAIVFFAVHQGLWGLYMGSIFAPNHKGMPTTTGKDRSDFLRRQVLTSRNVRGNWFIDFALGGLNYQIEHHLFPNMPTPHLRHARPIVRQYCAELGIAYHETSLFDSYAEALRHLHQAGAPLRASASS